VIDWYLIRDDFNAILGSIMAILDTLPGSTGATTLDPHTPAWAPQFSDSQYGRVPNRRCKLCSHYLFTYFFRVNGKKICENCAEQIRLGVSTASSSSLALAFMAGILGAAVAMIGYTTVIWGTGWTNGYFAVFIGWVIGRAVLAGANGIGSSRMQALAALLTYAAIALDNLPRLFWNAYNDPNAVINWRVVLPRTIIADLSAPVTSFDLYSNTSMLNFAALALGILVAIRLTRVQPMAVAGPFDVATT
jgi:hypothetical protein